MKYVLLLLIAILICSCQENSTPTKSKDTGTSKERVKLGSPRLVIHGGAGNILKKNLSEDQQIAYQKKLNEALTKGYAILTAGGTSEEAVIKAIQTLESSPLFNAGIGAVLTNEGTVSHDASIMDGATNQAGAIAGVNQIKSPILAAHLVKTNSKHVLLSGEGAHEFARIQGLEMVTPDYFITDKRVNQLNEAKKKNTACIDPYIKDFKMGTVGACALDQNGNLAAGTSTGGMTNKRFGRIGDSPLIGSGTYANNSTCAVSCTGHGEFFIRNVVAYDVAARMKYAKQGLIDSSNEVIRSLSERNGTGGLICLDQKGNINMPFNTAGMFRGYITDTSGVFVQMFNPE